MTIDLAVAEALRPLVRIGVVLSEVSGVCERDAGLDGPLAAAEAAVRAGQHGDITAARSLYKAIGLDPTRTRPSSEALLRRVRKGEALPRINTIVDIGNWCSVEYQLPYGLYDADRLVPPVSLRTGGPGDEYAGIRKDVVHLDGRFALFDAVGPFGNPTSDSARTMVTTATMRVLTVVYAPADVSQARMADVLTRTAARMAEFARGRETGRWVH
jgi:DNA/RNA-binding domain of Phe-tRNA-synthetase-like protein